MINLKASCLMSLKGVTAREKQTLLPLYSRKRHDDDDGYGQNLCALLYTQIR
jgi:hypothetical protein